jgi:NADPH-dependent curcumin reductase CurA
MEHGNLNYSETALQGVVMRSVLADLRTRLFESRQLTQSFDDGEARWRDGIESGLETAIEALEEALTKHFS